MISASRDVVAPSRRRRDSSPGEQVVGGLFFYFERFSGEIATRCVTHRLTKKEIKKMTKEIKAKIKSGAELDDDEEAFAEEHELWK